MFLVLCNAPPEEARRLARTVVREGLAACVNLVPGVQSVYTWEGVVQEEAETAMWIKTSASAVSALRERLCALHSYDTPEVLVLPIDAARSDARYVAWVRQYTPEVS